MSERETLLALAARCDAASDTEASSIIREAVLLCGKVEALTFIAVGALLDAAMTLVPEGWDWIIERTNGGLTIGAMVGHNDPDRMSWGATPALALCAAALRARAEGLA